MPFDGITIRALAQELNKDLLNARIDKIHQPEKDEIVLSIRQHLGGSVKLLISANPRWARLNISSDRRPNPSKPPTFCMLLRKYLEGGKIKEIKQIGFDRIIHIRIEALDDFRDWKDKILICEFMGKHSNIILVNPENNLIIDAIKKYSHAVSTYREVLPGKEYVSPPAQNKINPLSANYDQFAAAMWNRGKKSLATAFFEVYSGISPYSAQLICHANGLDPQVPVDECGEYEFSKLFTYTGNLLEDITRGHFKATVFYQRNKPLEYTLIDIPNTSPGVRAIETSSINQACDDFYTAKLAIVRLESMKTNLTRNLRGFLDKAYKKKFLQEGDLQKAHDNEVYRYWGELITAYAHQLKKGDKTAVLTDFYSDQEVTIELDPRYNPIQNAQKYFKIYNKSQRSLSHLKKRMAENQQEIDYLETLAVQIQQAESLRDITEITNEMEAQGYIKSNSHTRTKIEKSQPRRFESSDGLEILVGRNNYQNDQLTLKDSSKNDLWLHAKDIPGTHVIVRLPRGTADINQVPDTTLEEAAALAAYYSKANQSDKVAVDYTFRFNVRKPAGARPGMVIYDNHWTIMANPRAEFIDRLVE
ncbi:MAG: Rqc2 family fibronectin-binding protein [Syntrophomonadaceae bacterium]|jgi:predicted ribosome quality control (RQC) complex YloA/Tae2 family protein